MKNFDKASHIRRVVDNEAYDLIKEETYPEFDILHCAVVEELEGEGWTVEVGTLTDAMVQLQVKIFLNERVDEMRESVERKKQQATQELAERFAYEQAHMQTGLH